MNNTAFKLYIAKDLYANYLLQKSYPIILSIENSMRELIFKIMIFYAKEDWYEKEFPEKIKNYIKEDRKDLGLFSLDFSHLSSLIFEKNEKNKIEKLIDEIKSIESCNEVNLLKLKELIPKTNWEKYFKDIQIDKLEQIKNDIYNDSHLSNSKILEKLLDDLREYRNKIAHNVLYIDSSFYEEFSEKAYHLQQWIENALLEINSKMENFNIEQTKENIPEPIKILLKKIENLNQKIIELNIDLNTEDISKEQERFIENINFFRILKEEILNDMKPEINKNEIKREIENIDELIEKLDNLPRKEKKNDESYENTLQEDIIQEE